MKIFDLTRGKYPLIYDPIYSYDCGLDCMLHISSEFQSVFAQSNIDVSKLLNNIPVFLADSSMANEYVAVPGCQCSVRVPEDKSHSLNDNFDIDDWANSKEGDKDNPRERVPKVFTITDLFGVYSYSGECDFIPRRIFIWMDKIVDYTKNNSKFQSEITGNAQALFDLILFHEMAHALMDVELYGVHPAPNFSYANDYLYRFIEEAYANGIALTILMDNCPHLSSTEEKFIEHFIKNQGDGYSEGWDLYKHHIDNINQWMGLKILFNYEFARILRDWWKYKEFHNIKCYKSVGCRGWIAVKYYNDKWGLIELPNLERVVGFKKYDSFWSFDENGLCLVRLDEKPYLYGYVNKQGAEQIPVVYDHLYSFDNGITIAKKDGWYGAIDMNNKTVIPFSLPYEDVRGFRNGRAAVKNAIGKWGVIDAMGKEIVPCTSDHIIL